MKSIELLSADSRRLLSEAFGPHVEDVWVCWKGNWDGKPVRSLTKGDLPEDADCYFCPALLKPGAGARTNANACLMKVMVIDDVGTKISRDEFEMFAPEPSYWLESSAGNFQVGYMIKGGMDVETYRALRRSMKSNSVWGHADGVDPVHLFRLPQGINSKPGAGGWKVRLAS